MTSPAPSTSITVRGFHCDLYGHVNNARYLEFLEEARWELLEQTFDLDTFHAKGLSFVVVGIDIAYRQVARPGDRLRVLTGRGDVGRTRFAFHQEVRRGNEEKVVAEATVTLVVVDRESGRPVPLREEVRALIEALAGEEEA